MPSFEKTKENNQQALRQLGQKEAGGRKESMQGAWVMGEGQKENEVGEKGYFLTVPRRPKTQSYQGNAEESGPTLGLSRFGSEEENS